MAIDRRLLFNIDWGFLGAALILMGIGVATILSATFAGRNTGLEVKQLYAIALGLVGMLVVVSLDYRRLVDRAPVLYLAAVGVLEPARARWLTDTYIAYRTVLHHISLEGQGERVVQAAPYADTRARVVDIWREVFA